ncbi:hypothetical protein Dimus_039553 [Dionaea muscipula]
MWSNLPALLLRGELSDHVCRLKKSLYGLKQSPRTWFGCFSSVVMEFGMQRFAKDHSIFYKHSSTGCIFLVVYMDDIVIIGSDSTGIMTLKVFLQRQFQTKDLGQLKYFLGIEVARCKRGIFLSQRKYVLDLLQDMSMLDVKSSDTPMLPEVKLLPEEGDTYKEPDQYRRFVGKLNYLSITRPDIAFPVSVVSQFMADPRTPHWEAVVHILRYVKGHSSKGLFYSDHRHRCIEGFSDADWAGSPFDRRSTTGYCVFVGGNLVFWKSKKQSVVVRSSAESEYRALAYVTSDATYFRQLLDELKYPAPRPTQLRCDSQSVIHIASNPVFYERTKHIEVDCHFVREKLQDGDIVLNHVKTKDQLGDILTKPLVGNRVKFLCNKLGMINIYAPT